METKNLSFLQGKTIQGLSYNKILIQGDKTSYIGSFEIEDGKIVIKIIETITHEIRFDFDEVCFCQHGERPEDCDFCNK